MASIFTKIIEGQIPAYKVAEDKNYLAFFDINPVQKGHVLVIPKIEVDYIFDLDKVTLQGLMSFAQKVAKGIEAVIDCQRIGVTVIGLEVPHAHIHLIPINSLDDLSFKNKRKSMTPDAFKQLANEIRSRIDL